MLTVSEVFDQFRDRALALGGVRCIWFISPAAHAVSHDQTLVLHWGFAPEWTSFYASSRHSVPEQVEKLITEGRPTHWKETVAKVRANKRAANLWPVLDLFEKLHPEQGFAFPVFGPFGVQSLVSCAMEPSIDDFDDPRFLDLAANASEALRLIALIKNQEYRDTLRLSPRELDVLRELCAGKSKKEIARSIALAPASVDTYARRIFFKMGVDDRVEAVVKAMSMGLVKL